MTQPRAQPVKPRHLAYQNFDQVRDDIQTLFRLMQPKTFRIVAAVPIATDLNEGEAVLYDNESTTRRVYYKVNGTLRYAALT